MKKNLKLFPYIVLAITALWLIAQTRMPKDGEGKMRIHEFGQLPVLFQGRVKPIDTLARNSLTIVSDKAQGGERVYRIA